VKGGVVGEYVSVLGSKSGIFIYFLKSLKVTKCENFDGSDFHDFYTMKHF
jgi:hypothetical protein